MNNLLLYCLSLYPNNLNIIKKIGYIPVGLGKENFSDSWETDKIGKNISNKNSYYGEYTFHYRLWKNDIIKKNDIWIGFCQYRKFWLKKKVEKNNLSFFQFNSLILKEIPKKFSNYESILGEEIFINKLKFSKFVKHGFKKIFLNPRLVLNKNKRNLKFHFDMWHGEGNLDKAINLLDKSERSDFQDFVNKKISFNPHNMFICKNKNILFKYYDSVFPWLERCEKIFGFKNLKGYGLQRIYGFLAERYLSYWFKKYTKYTVLPIIFKDISDFNYKNL